MAKSPTTGNGDPTARDDTNKTASRPRPRSGRTSTAGSGERSPRLPHERDESNDTEPGAPSETMRKAKEDAESSKVATDRSEEADAAYATLCGKPPGRERDGR